MTLGEKQRLFAKLYTQLLVWIHQNPSYSIAFGELERKPVQAKLNAKNGVGIANSLHIIRLAGDILLFIDGVYQTDSEKYRPLGEFWKSLHPLCRWGGDFKDGKGRPKPDGNHFSLEHNGVK